MVRALVSSSTFNLPEPPSLLTATFHSPACFPPLRTRRHDRGTSIAVHAVRLAAVRPGSTAVVVGSGMIGLLAIQALCIEGVDPLVAVVLGRTMAGHRFGDF
jgi:hypothetical protein